MNRVKSNTHSGMCPPLRMQYTNINNRMCCYVNMIIARNVIGFNRFEIAFYYVFDVMSLRCFPIAVQHSAARLQSVLI